MCFVENFLNRIHAEDMIKYRSAIAGMESRLAKMTSTRVYNPDNIIINVGGVENKRGDYIEAYKEYRVGADVGGTFKEELDRVAADVGGTFKEELDQVAADVGDIMSEVIEGVAEIFDNFGMLSGAEPNEICETLGIKRVPVEIDNDYVARIINEVNPRPAREGCFPHSAMYAPLISDWGIKL